MNKEQIRDIGQQRLMKIGPTTEGIRKWKAYLIDYQPSAEYPDDAYVWLTCTLALEAVEIGNFGVGCVLTNDCGNVVAQGHNEVFNPHFRSDRHAEMVVMDDFENANPGLTNLDGYTLYTSLEPCPMCLVRLSTSRVSKVLFAAPDVDGGMIHRMNNLPPFWIELAQRKVFNQAQCSQGLVNAATQILLLNLDELTERVKAR
jgi:Cytosine/adenosine deaminases